MKSTDLVVDKNLAANEFASIVCDVQNSVGLYQAYRLKDEMQSEGVTNIIEASAVRYTAKWSTDQKENQFEQDELLYSMDGNQLLASHRQMNMHELLDDRGSAERRGFIEEVQLYMHGNKQEGAYIFCSRSLESAEFKVPPLMVLRFRKFTDKGMLAVDCMVRDEFIKIEQVIQHWDWVADNYVSSLLAEV